MGPLLKGENMKGWKVWVVLSAMMVVLVSAFGQEAKKNAAPVMDEKAMMDMMMKLATPGAAHEKLDVLVGSWDVKNTMWMDPSKAPMVSEGGVAENKWVLGGRFLEQRFEGKFMGMPFSGIGYTGYDNYKKKYLGTWMDNFGTTIMNTTGSFDSSGKVLRSTARMDDFSTGKVITVREVLNIVNKDELRLEMFGPGPDGRDFRMMEIVYKRKKAGN
jgi:hypothetical protein